MANLIFICLTLWPTSRLFTKSFLLPDVCVRTEPIWVENSFSLLKKSDTNGITKSGKTLFIFEVKRYNHETQYEQYQ